MKIRLMTLGDYRGAYSLWLSCNGMGLSDIDDTEEGVARFLLRNPETCFVAEKHNEIIGTILVGNDGRRGYIYHAAVKADERLAGVGTQLVEAAMAALKKAGIHKASLVVLKDNESGNAFWERLGFTLRTDLLHRNKETN